MKFTIHKKYKNNKLFKVTVRLCHKVRLKVIEFQGNELIL